MAEPERNVLRETDDDAIALARHLLRAARFAALAVAEPETGWPLASRVSLATDCVGHPVILISNLSAHTGALLADARCTLLVGEPGKGDPLAHPRMTVKCRARRIAREAHDEHGHVARRFLNRHPKAKLYAGFADFAYFQLDVEDASLNGGFGKAYHITREQLLSDANVAADLSVSEQDAIDHMNADHKDAIALYAAKLAGIDEVLDWRMTGIDPDGVDIMAGDRTARIAFPAPLTDADALRATLVEMARNAREN